MMRMEKAERLLNLVRRVKPTDMTLSIRPKLMAVIKRKLMNQLRVPTRGNPSFHLYRDVDLMTAQAAKSVFFDLKKKGPFLRGKSIYYNFETDSNQVMKSWFALEERRDTGMGHALLRSHGSVLVMARPPMLVEHQCHDEAEGIKISCGVMTLNCRGVPRFAPPPAPELDTPAAAKERQLAAERDLNMAWRLVQLLAERGTCTLDRHWYYALAERFDNSWLSYLTEECDLSPDTSDGEVIEENSEEEEEEAPAAAQA